MARKRRPVDGCPLYEPTSGSLGYELRTEHNGVKDGGKRAIGRTAEEDPGQAEPPRQAISTQQATARGNSRGDPGRQYGLPRTLRLAAPGLAHWPSKEGEKPPVAISGH
jgi:hypothetical protein